MRISSCQPPVQQKTNNSQKPSFKGVKSGLASDVKGKVLGFFEPNSDGSMTRGLFTGSAFTFLLGGRLMSSRDKNEYRETLTRDIPTILLAVYGVPVIEKILAKKIQEKKGFAILDESTKKLRPIANSKQLEDWYKLDKKTVGGLDAVAKRIENLGGDLKKIFSEVSDNVKTKLKDCKPSEVINEIKNNAELRKEISMELLKEDNVVMKKAKWLKSIPKYTGFGATLGIIGLFIPKLNIMITEMVNKGKDHDNDTPKNEK